MKPQPVAYSYIRFSSVEQGQGDSLRRQTTSTADWCAKNNVRLDTSLSLRDLGVSAFKGKNRSDTSALGSFIKAVEEKRVPAGSFLIVESLDRLTREDLRTAVRLWLTILDLGISIVSLSPEKIYRHDKTQMEDVFIAVIELSRGHSESALKSERVGKAWGEKKARARRGEHIITRKLPAWVKRVGDKLELIPKRAEMVKQIFALASSGLGHAAIVKKLTADKIPAMTPSGEWCRSHVANILRDRRALGEFQPKKRDGAKDGAPINAYFPPCVSEADYFAARAAAGKRRQKSGSVDRTGGTMVNAFAGLVTTWDGSDTFYLATRTNGGKHSHVLLNSATAEGKAVCTSFPYLVFEKKILEQLAELDPVDVLGHNTAPDALGPADKELKAVRGRIDEMKRELRTGSVSAAMEVLRDLEKREAELVECVDTVRQEQASPASESFDAVKQIATGMNGGADGRSGLRAVLGALEADPVNVRVKLRSALRRLIQNINVVFVPTGRTRVALVRMRFLAGGMRNYIIVAVPPKANAKKRTPGYSHAWTVRLPDDVVDPRRTLAALLSEVIDELEKLVVK